MAQDEEQIEARTRRRDRRGPQQHVAENIGTAFMWFCIGCRKVLGGLAPEGILDGVIEHRTAAVLGLSADPGELFAEWSIDDAVPTERGPGDDDAGVLFGHFANDHRV